MDFYEVLDDVLELLRSRGRVTYRALKRQFKSVGRQEVQLNGPLVRVSPGDARLPTGEGWADAWARYEPDRARLRKMRQEPAPALAEDGFSPAECDDLIALKQARYEVLQGDLDRVRDVMEVFAFPRLMARGVRPVSVRLNGYKHQNLEGEDNLLGKACRCRLMEAWGLK